MHSRAKDKMNGRVSSASLFDHGVCVRAPP